MIFPIVLSTIFKATLGHIFVQLDDGIIKGLSINSTLKNTTQFYAFHQIPYAAPPIDDLRFKPPQPVTRWEGILDATKNTKICYQVGLDLEKETEDCLYLNVYTPEVSFEKIWEKLTMTQEYNRALLPSNNKQVFLPVMVYIYGGGFLTGDSTHDSYGPEFLINYEVIVVTLNYRLGPFGFLSTQDNVISGNNGLKDQLFALQWVNKNIHLFGGDASKITIFGQSAGAASVGYHLISGKSRGLYRAAIMESGSPLNPWAYQRNAKKYAFQTASYIYPDFDETKTSEELLEALMNVSASQIDAASGNVIKKGGFFDGAQLLQGFYYAPVLEQESEDAFLTEKMFEIVERGDASRVPVIIGINSEESLGQSTNLNFLSMMMKKFDDNLDLLVPNNMNIESKSVKIEVGENIRKFYSGKQLLREVPAAGVRYLSDTTFTRSIIKYASLQSQYSDVYFYQFSYDGLMGNVSVIVKGAERVGHCEEVAYLWRIQSDMFNNHNLTIYPETDIITQNRILTLWTNFARTLKPTPEKDKLLQKIDWPKFSQNNNYSYLNIDDNLEIKNHPKEDSFAVWNQLYEKYGRKPYDTY